LLAALALGTQPPPHTRTSLHTYLLTSNHQHVWNFLDGWKLSEKWSDPEHGVPTEGYFCLEYVTPHAKDAQHDYRQGLCKQFLVGTVV
jgi:hypothetical protein